MGPSRFAAAVGLDADALLIDEHVLAKTRQKGVGQALFPTVDALGPVPSGGYRYLRIWSPINWPNNDGAEVDSIEIVP